MALITAIDRAQAHTRGDLELWMEEWIERADDSLSPGLVMEYQDMRSRHLWYFDPQPSRPVDGPSSSGWSGTVESWRGLVSLYFPAEQVNRALCIMSHESKGNPNALNTRGSSAAGLFQFLRGTWDGVPTAISGGSYDSGAVYNPEANIAAAAWLWERSGGWGPWTVRGLC